MGLPRVELNKFNTKNNMKGSSDGGKISRSEDDIPIIKMGENHIAKLESTKKNIRKEKPIGSNVGSVPYGLPTEAIYRRRPRDVV